MVPGLARQILPSLLMFSALVLESAPASAEDANAALSNAAAGAPIETGSVKRDTEIGGDNSRTRFVIGLERKTDYQVFALSSPTNRVIVDLPEMKLQLPEDTGGKPVGLISAFRAGLSAPGRTRIVIDVMQPVIVEASRIEKSADGVSQRLAIDIIPAAAKSKAERKTLKTPPFALGAAGLQPPLPQKAVRPEVKAAKSFKPVIVIDPGHGGHDSGATRHGTVEKDVVLAFSQVLKRKIEVSGRYRVLMTRDTDVFVELDERRAFAERHNAALFIAVHADYAQTRARGATIYSLRESVANALEGSTKREVSANVLSSTEAEKVKKAGDTSDVEAVKSILGDLARREVDTTKERTSLFSRAVIEYMGETTNMRNDPDQQAAFRVLKTAQFPSVLIELAYVTNEEDAEQLKSDSWRNKVSDSIMTAVDTYFSQQVARLPM